jgi:hypothetical protein
MQKKIKNKILKAFLKHGTQKHIGNQVTNQVLPDSNFQQPSAGTPNQADETLGIYLALHMQAGS